MKKTITLLVFLASCVVSHAVTTLQLGSGGTLTNLQNSLGQNNQTLVWGLVVDTDNNGFSSSYLPSFSVTDTTTAPLGRFLTLPGDVVSGDRLFISSNLMATGGTTDGSAGLAKPTNIFLEYAAAGATGVLAAGGQTVAIMWFDYTTKTGQLVNGGDNYGLYILPFETPPDTLGGSLAVGASFIGADSVRVASAEFIPETSTALLGALGALGLLRRRR